MRRSSVSARVCQTMRIFFVLIGGLGLIVGEGADLYHTLLHLATGMAVLWIGFARPTRDARRFGLGFGAFYLALGGLGALLGNPAQDRTWDLGLFVVSTGDHVFHTVLGTVFLVGGLLTRPVVTGAGGSASSGTGG